MTATLSIPSIVTAPVVARRSPCREHFEITIRLPSFPEAVPGQFLSVLCRDAQSMDDSGAGAAMLRRPFSIGGLRRSTDGVEIDILGRVVGPGTAWLDALQVGDELNVLGPLGRGFTMPDHGERALLIAGGVGLPPIRWLCEFLRKSTIFCDVIYGAQSRDLLPISFREAPRTDGSFTMCVEEFAREGAACLITTDDGSCGVRGRVTDGLTHFLSGANAPGTVRVYSCGPEPMLRAVATMCAERGLRCEAAMERVMGCGMGTCQSCVVPIVAPDRATSRRYALCCREGPVFDTARVIW